MTLLFNFVEISLIRIEILRKGISLLKQYDAKKILNIALAGHSGSGKTSVAVLGAMEPVTAVCVGIAIFGEPFTRSIALGILLIISAVTVIILKR